MTVFVEKTRLHQVWKISCITSSHEAPIPAGLSGLKWPKWPEEVFPGLPVVQPLLHYQGLHQPDQGPTLAERRHHHPCHIPKLLCVQCFDWNFHRKHRKQKFELNVDNGKRSASSGEFGLVDAGVMSAACASQYITPWTWWLPKLEHFMCVTLLGGGRKGCFQSIGPLGRCFL